MQQYFVFQSWVREPVGSTMSTRGRAALLRQVARLRAKLRQRTAEMDWWWRESRRHLENKQWFQAECRRLQVALETCHQDVRVSSPLTTSETWARLECCYPGESLWCETGCPMCKRPLDLKVWWPGRAPVLQAEETQDPRGSRAYCAVLWGASPGYALGAMVLGARLRELCTASSSDSAPPDLVLLHTDDVPSNYLALLERVWILRMVEFVDAVPALYNRNGKGDCFNGVFTKLHAWGLIQYQKVLLVDLDIIPLQSIEDLFELEAPAAMVRGNYDWPPHGCKVDGRSFFRAEDDKAKPWGQGGGINAGVILLQPCAKTVARMLSEVTSEVHPGHVAGAGPEQDYLTRFFAVSCGPWHNINVAYNFQLHHVPFALEAVLRWLETIADGGGNEEGFKWLPSRLALSEQEVRNVHFSGDVKLWHVLLDAAGDANRLSLKHVRASWEDEDAFVEHLLRSCCENYGRWMEDGASSECGFVLSRLRAVARLAVSTWHGCAKRLLKGTPALLEELLNPHGPSDTHPVGARVEFFWPPAAVVGQDCGCWYTATVASVHADGKYNLKMDRGGSWGDSEREVPPERVRVSQSGG